jgi:hydroxyacylglutathione hydrolase
MSGELRYQTIPVTAFQQNCSIVWCGATRRAAIIDPGGDLDVLLAAVKKLGVRLEQIWCTHGHIDHVGGVSALAAQLNLPIYGPHEADAFWINGLPQQGQMFGFARSEPFVPQRWLTDGDTLSLGECSLSVRHCPGHTPGHVVLHHAGSARVFVGDVLFVGSVGRTDFPQGNAADLRRSILERVLPMGDEVVFIPGHGPEGTLGHERRTNPFLR